MPPPGRFQNLEHRIRRLHPLRMAMGHSLCRMESASVGEIRRYQERRLRALVRVAATRSPFYREWFAQSGLNPTAIRTLDDLDKLPLLTRADLVDQPERFRVYPSSVMWKAHSSGTSGSVVTTYRTPGSSAFELSALERQWRWFGTPPRPRRAILRHGSISADSDLQLSTIVPGARQIVLSSYRLTAANLPRLLDQVRAFGPQIVEGWPSSITLFAALLCDMGQTLPVAAVVTSSEVMTAEQKRLMHQAFAAPIVDHYGQTERVAMAGGCEFGGYHVFPDYGIVELVPVAGHADRREIVGTPLHNWGFPLFRYRTGDEVGPAPGEPCPCGRAFQLLGPIDGRREDAFLTADGRILPLPSCVVDDLVGLREVQVAQLAPGRFEFRMVPSLGGDIPRVQAHALRNVERYFGPDQSVSFRVLDRIPRSPSGKLRPAIVEGGREKNHDLVRGS